MFGRKGVQHGGRAMRKAHWEPKDFRLTTESHDGEFGVQKGYCGVCGADMQRFKEGRDSLGHPVWGQLYHYNSHKAVGKGYARHIFNHATHRA